MAQRWDDDERGRGVGDAGAYAAGASELVEAMDAPGWVAENPDAHLLPHLAAACEALPLALRASRTSGDGTFEVELEWRGAPGVGEIRRGIYALVGSIAESASYVRQRRDAEGELTFEVVTGELDGRFAPHGHTVRFVITP
ncbi:MAG: hypothetical protein ACJ747_10930 [Gaiellaceae bacterium]|jgi:hypothetical protein